MIERETIARERDNERVTEETMTRERETMTRERETMTRERETMSRERDERE